MTQCRGPKLFLFLTAPVRLQLYRPAAAAVLHKRARPQPVQPRRQPVQPRRQPAQLRRPPPAAAAAPRAQQ